MRGVFVFQLSACWLMGLTVCAALDPASGQLAARYHAILERNPASETAAERLWEIYSASGESEKFLKQLRDFAEQQPMAGLSLAGFLQRSGQGEEAKAALQNISTDTLDAKALIRIGRLWGMLGKPDQAVMAWEKAVAAEPENPALRAEIAQAYMDAGNPAAAIGHWEILANKSTASERLLALENLSLAYEASGDLSQAALNSKMALNSLAPGHWKIQDLTERTIRLHEKAGELESLEAEWANQPGLATRMAVLAKKRGDSKAHAQWLRKALEADPKNVALLRDLAFAELADGNLEAAEGALRKRHFLNPNDEEMVGDLASFLANQGEEAEALTLIDSFFERSPRDESRDSRKIALLKKLNLREGLGKALQEGFALAKDSWPAARELAEHLLQTGSSAEAFQVAETLDQSTRADARRETRLNISRLFYDMQVPGESEKWARKALEAEPWNHETILLLSEILEVRGDILPALELVERAAPASVDKVDLELDQRLFSLLQRRDSEADPALRNIGTKAFLQTLLEKGNTGESADRLIRASRWAAWTGDSASAITSLRSALALRTDSPELLDRLANELEKSGEFQEAALVLQRLDALLPAPATKIRMARMDVARGEAEAAVTLLALAANESPNDANLAREVAIAREAAGQNFEALESWLRAFELSPPSEKQNLSKSVLKSFSRLSLVDRGLEFLAVTAPRLPDDRIRLEFLRDGTAFARENDVLDRWQLLLESQTSPSSVAWKMALSELQPEMPDPESPPVVESVDALELLLQDAEAKGDFGRAVFLAGELAALPKAGPQAQVRYLHFLEMTQTAQKTEESWNTVLRKFPRSPEVQLAAAEFFRRHGNEAREVEGLRAASRLGPLPAQVMLRMAGSPRNDKATAFEDYEALLERIPSDPTPARNPPPFPKRLSKLPGFLSPSEADPQACRLLALREMGQLLENSPTKLERLDNLTEAAPMEKAWAYWGAGEEDRALDLLLAIPDPDDQKSLDKAYVALGLEVMSFERLQKWANAAETLEERWMLISEIMTSMISSGWQPPGGDLKAFLERSPAFVRLRTAETLAASGFLRAAVEVGIPAGMPPSLEAEARFRLAGWKFTLRDPEGAARQLAICLELNGPSGSFENLNFSAIRALWLLEDPDNRDAFEQSALTRIQNQGSPRATHAAKALFFALRGDKEKFCDAIALWFGESSDGTTSPSLLALRAANTLENWNLLARARDICRTALDLNPALSHLSGDIGIERTLENAIIVSLLMESQPATSRYLVNEWAARGAKREELAAAGARAAGTGRIATARILHERVFAMQPMNPTSWLQLLALRALPDGKSNQPVTWYLSASEDMRNQIPGQTVLQLAYALSDEGDIPKALEVLEVVPMSKATPPILQAKDQLLVELGKKEPVNPPSTPAMDEEPEGVTGSTEKILAAKQALEEQWNREWAEGSSAAGELLIRLAIEKNDPSRLRSLIKGFTEAPLIKPSALSSLSKLLMENQKYAGAVQVFERLDEFGIPDHSQALTFAEALWKTGRRADALDIARAFELTSKVDPALRLSLAAFFLSVDRPDAAIFQMDQPDQNFAMVQKSAPLRAAAAALLLARGRVDDAKIQMAIAAQVPGATPPDLVANYYEHLGNNPLKEESKVSLRDSASEGEGQSNPGLFGLSPASNEFALGEKDLLAFRWVVAQRAFDAGLQDVALHWLSIDPRLASSPEAVGLASKAGDASAESLKTYWSLVAESPRSAARAAAKTYFAETSATPAKPRL